MVIVQPQVWTNIITGLLSDSGIFRQLIKKGCVISQNPLTAKVAKFFRKARKEVKFSKLPLRTLRKLGVLCS